MGKIFIFLLLAIPATLLAQNTPLLFDKKMVRTTDLKKAKYGVRPDTLEWQAVYYLKKPTRIFAKGKIIEADTLSFDGKAVFEDINGTLRAVRYYNQGVLKPLMFINDHFEKRSFKKSCCYMAISDKGYFYAYRIFFQQPDPSRDELFAQGMVTDTTSLALNGRIFYYDNKGYVTKIRKFIQGKPAPFIVSTLNINEPYEIVKVMTYTATISSHSEVNYHHDKFVEEGRNTGEDGIIGISTSLSPINDGINIDRQSLIIQGTLIRLKNK